MLITRFAVLKAGRHYRLVYEVCIDGSVIVKAQWRNWFRGNWYNPEWIDGHRISVGEDFPIDNIRLARACK